MFDTLALNSTEIKHNYYLWRFSLIESSYYMNQCSPLVHIKGNRLVPQRFDPLLYMGQFAVTRVTSFQNWVTKNRKSHVTEYRQIN